LPDGDHRDFRISIREENGPALMVLSLLPRVERNKFGLRPVLGRRLRSQLLS
jgi:hypothetical protein